MIRRNSTSILLIYLIYLAAMAMTTALLVFWVVVVQRFNTEINQLLSRLGVEWGHFHWFVHPTGAGLFFLVIVALTYLLAVTLSERRYSGKREQFLSNITHELKSPVAAIKLHAQTLQQDDITPAERQRFVGYMVREAERVDALVENLLESSRLLAGKTTDGLVPVNLREFFRDYQDAVRGRFDLRQIDLSFEIHTRAVVMATTETLRRIMDNLIDNAVRFTDAGGRIRCKVHDGRQVTEIVVADTGIGIPKRELTRIFDRFYQLRREIGNRRRGTGLGLAIVRALVEDMRGHIRAVSPDDQPGTRFEIQLPQVQTDETAPGPS
ncbi:MAG: HAMP domain-containing histidine kinase [bacterium]|nr:HAMP domain-containing histidine kinase [bacterium]